MDDCEEVEDSRGDRDGEVGKVEDDDDDIVIAESVEVALIFGLASTVLEEPGGRHPSIL